MAILSDSGLSKTNQLTASLGWFALYLASGFLVVFFQGADGEMLCYPQFAVGVTFLYRTKLKNWPLVFLAEFCVSFYENGGSAAEGLIFAAGTTFEIAASAFALRRFGRNLGIADHHDFARLAMICAATTFIGSSLESIVIYMLAGVDGAAWTDWFTGWFADTVSAISLLPLILILSENTAEDLPTSAVQKSRWEQAALLAAAVGLCYATFGHAPLIPLPIQVAIQPLIFGPVIWTALRLGRRATCIAILTTAASAMLFRWATWLSDARTSGPGYHEMLEVQILLAALSVSGLALALALERERRARVEAESREAEVRRISGELHTALTRLSMAADVAHIGVWDRDLADNSLVWDDQVFEMYQASRDTPDRYRLWLDRLHPEDAERLLKEIAQAVKDGKEMRSNFRVLLPDGDVRYFNTHGIAQQRPDGGGLHLIGIDYDVTELVRQRLRAQESEVNAATANRAKSQFLMTMSHELRTPLNVIIGFSDLMVNETCGPLENRQYAGFVHDIKNSGQVLLSLINDVLDLARIDTGKLHLNLESVDPNTALQDIARLVGPLATAKNQSLSIKATAPCGPLLADRRALRQLLNNLVVNSVKFTNDGGAIMLSAETVDAGHVALLVTDNGRGIPRERIPDLCKPFVQVADALSRDVGGIGLGLAISRSLAEAMDGTLEIYSEFGKGTIVRVTLPAAPIL